MKRIRTESRILYLMILRQTKASVPILGQAGRVIEAYHQQGPQGSMAGSPNDVWKVEAADTPSTSLSQIQRYHNQIHNTHIQLQVVPRYFVYNDEID